MDHDRRGLIAGAIACLVSPPALARVGLVGRSEVVDMLGELEAVEEGRGGLVQVILSPDCGHSLAIFDVASGLLDRCRWRWIPFSGQTDQGRAAVARVLADRTRRSLQAELVPYDQKDRRSLKIDAGLEAMVRRQDDALDLKIGRYLWEATFKAFATPTAVFTDGSGLTRVVRGDPKPEDIAWIAETAA